MTVSTKTMNYSGNQDVVDGVTVAYDAMTDVAIPAATQPSVCAGTGAPTFTANKGTLYLRLDGSSSSTRAYINTTGSTTWTAVTTAA